MSRNIVKDYIDYNRKDLLEYFKLTFNDEELKGIPNKMIDIYIYSRYYNLYNSDNYALINDIIDNIKDKTFEYAEKEEIKVNRDLKEKIYNSLWILKYILYFEKASNNRKIMNLLKELEEKVESRTDSNNIIKTKLFPVIKENQKKKEKFIKRCSCKDFELKVSTTNITDVFYTNLISNVKIPELFSASAIKRVYETGTVSEDKLLVWYTLVSVKILEDINNFIYSSKYVVSFDANLFSKKTKRQQLFKIIDLDFLKERISFVIYYEDFINNKDMVYDYIREGFKFDIIIKDDFSDSVQLLEVFEYIILNGKIENMSKLKKVDNVIIMDLIGV